MSEISRVGVVGCGLMGAGVVEVCARAGLDVSVVVSGERSRFAGAGRVTASLERAVHKGKLSGADRDAALKRIAFTTALGDLADRQIVFECTTEHEPAKLALFAALDAVVTDPDAILASNTSSLSIDRLAHATVRPDRVIGTHFFNPVPVMALVEVVASPSVSELVLARTEAFVVERMGKKAIRSSDRAGFVVNAMLVPFLMSAIRMVEEGHALPADIDHGMVLGCGHPMGPLALADFTGLDTLIAVADSLHRETKDVRFEPPALLHDMVAAGRLGKKSGGGFFDYPA